MDYLVHHMLRASAERAPNDEALVHRQRRLSFSEMYGAAASIAAGLSEAGARRGDRIGIFLDPSIELATSLFGISASSAAFVPIHHSLFPQQVAHIAQDCGMTGLITDSARIGKLSEALRECTSLKFLVSVDGGERVEAGLPVLPWSAMSEPAAKPGRLPAIEHDLAAILYTSGSTGKPKGVMLSHANVLAGASIVSEYLNITRNDRILAALPFSFDAGLNQIMTAVQQGGTTVLVRFLLAREIVDALIAERITGLAGVPPLWSLLAQPSSTLAARKPELRYITNTGGALPLPVLERLRAALPGAQVFLMYGLTEAFRSTYLPPEELDRRPTSMGRAIPNTEILVVNDEGRLCGPNEVGELVHHGPTVSMGYWGQPELTDRVLRPHPCPTPGLPATTRVCYSGDLVRKDDEGFLYFVSRRDNQIKSSGFRISPNEVEAALCASGMLQHAAVVGVPDELLGQRIEAFGVAPEGTKVDADAVLRDCATRLPRYMIPRSLEILEAIPRTSSGKTDYTGLRQRAIERDAATVPANAGAN